MIFSFHSTKTSSGREKAASESPSWVVMVLVSPALPDPDPVLLPRRVERKLWIGINLDTDASQVVKSKCCLGWRQFV